MVKGIFSFKSSSSGLFETKPARDKQRAFRTSQKKAILSKQGGKFTCARCHKRKDASIMECHHVKDWAKGGKTKTKNGRGLCPDCHAKIHLEERAKYADGKTRNKKASPFGFTAYKSPKLPKLGF